MTTSIIITLIVAAVAIAWLIWSRQKQAHHLDDMHIAPQPDEAPETEEKDLESRIRD